MDAVYQAPDFSVKNDAAIMCRSCRQQMPLSASRCPQCGTSRRTSRYKNKTVAAILALFLGSFGVHRFYLGQWRGIVYLLFCWLWIPGIVAFIECIYFAATDRRKWDAKHNEGIPAGPGDSAAKVVDIVVLVVASLVVIALVGMMTAIALPAYKDYELRAKSGAALSATLPIREEVERHLQTTGQMPQVAQFSSVAAAHDYPDYQLSVTAEGIVIRFKGDDPGFGNETIVVIPVPQGRAINWYCTGGTLPNRYRPGPCKVANPQPAG